MMKLLFVVAGLPEDTLDGITLPIAGLVPEFAKHAEVTIATFGSTQKSVERSRGLGASRVLDLSPRSKRQLRPVVPRGISRYYSAHGASELEDMSFDLIVAHRLHTSFVSLSPRSGRRILIVQDLLSKKLAQYSRAPKVTTKVGERWYRAVEQRTFPWFESLHVVSEDEKQKLIDSHGDQHNVVVSPNGVTPWESRGWESNEHFLGYFGGLRSRRNQRALARLRDIVGRLPEETRPILRVVGAGANPELESELRADDRVDFVGRCENPEEALKGALAIVNPQSEATGVKNSVLEPMSGGHTLIVSDAIAAGIGIEHDIHALVSHTDEDFVRSLTGLQDNSQMRHRIGKDAALHVARNFSWAAYADQIVNEEGSR